MSFTPPQTPKISVGPQARDILATLKEHPEMGHNAAGASLINLLERMGAGASVPGASGQIRLAIPVVEALAASERKAANYTEGEFDVVKSAALKMHGAQSHDAAACHDYLDHYAAAGALAGVAGKLSQLASSPLLAQSGLRR